MTVGPFVLQEPVPELRSPRVFLCLQPWIDVGSVGTMALTFLEEAWGAQPLGQLARPGDFYDFTRYRPMLYRREGQRHVTVPNTFIRYAQGPGDRDWLVLHALEPHSRGEEYVEGVMALFRRLGVSEYFMVGSMYAPVPHTRPPVASGGSTDGALRARLQACGVRESGYEGPTTILSLLPGLAGADGIPSATVVLQLPAYAQIERDYRGLHAMLQLLSGLYGLSLNLDALRLESERQVAAIDENVQQAPRVQEWVRELEALYDAEPAPASGEEPAAQLSPELERFIRDVERRWDDGERR
ncbi:MAG: PAC2 family protein [Dehalococcoidia bacterium]|nr:PAC2 family protein [Dehalococcoidia bacterium]